MTRRRSMTGDSAPRLELRAGEAWAPRAWVLLLTPRRWLARVDHLAVVLLTLAAAIRLALMLKGWPPLSGDEAIIGLMGRHILYQHELPVFYWGQDYMGAFEAYLAAGFFAIFGPSLIALRLMTLALTLGFLAAVYALGRAAYSRAVGVLALAWLAFGPSLALMREIQPIGGYQETLLLGALVLLGVWARLREPAPRPADARAWRRCGLTYAGIGLAAGIGLWSDLLILPALVAAFATLIWARWDEVRSRAGLVLALSFIVGALPFLVYNIALPNATYVEVSRLARAPGASSLLPAPLDWARQIGSTLAVALPIVLGSPHVCVTSGNVGDTYPPLLAVASASPAPACLAGNLALSGGFLLVLGYVAWHLLRAVRAWAAPAFQRTNAEAAPASGDTSSHIGQHLERLREMALALGRARGDQASLPHMAVEAEATARLWLRGMLLATVLLTLCAYSVNFQVQNYQFDTARYLLPIYLGAPLLAGVLWSGARRLVVWATGAPRPGRGPGRHLARLQWPRWPYRRRLLPLACGAGLALAVGCTLFSGIVTLVHAGDTRLFGMPRYPGDDQVLAALDRVSTHTFYSDYRTCYRLAFETNERLICAVRGQGGPSGLALAGNRRWSYVLALRADPHPAYLLPANTPEDRDFAAEAALDNLPHDSYARMVVGAYAIYYYASSRATAQSHPPP